MCIRDRPFPNPSGIFTFKNGRNGDGVFSLNLSNKWLRIGNPGGIAFWGDSNIDTNDNPQFKIASGGITSYVPLGVVDNNFNINSHNIKAVSYTHLSYKPPTNQNEIPLFGNSGNFSESFCSSLIHYLWIFSYICIK